MSVVLGKRQYLGLNESEVQDFDSRRYRTAESNSVREIVFFQSLSFEENLSRLSLLFPTMENKELSDCLESSNNNLEEAIQLLEGLSLNKQDLPRQYARALVTRFESASKEEAVEIAAIAFNQFYQDMKSQESKEHIANRLPQDTEKLRDAFQKLIQDNSTLKRAVIKLKEKADSAAVIERELAELKNEVQQLNLANYMLRMHLQNEMEGKNLIEKSKDIF